MLTKKFDITMVQTRVATFTIEAHSHFEAVDLVRDRIKRDDYFCDEIESMYENGVDDEVIRAIPSDPQDGVHVDYSYESMVGKSEDEEEDEE